MDSGCYSDTTRLRVGLYAHDFAFTGDLDGGGACEFGRQSHGEFDFRILPDLAIHVKEDATRADIAGLGMHSGI